MTACRSGSSQDLLRSLVWALGRERGQLAALLVTVDGTEHLTAPGTGHHSAGVGSLDVSFLRFPSSRCVYPAQSTDANDHSPHSSGSEHGVRTTLISGNHLVKFLFTTCKCLNAQNLHGLFHSPSTQRGNLVVILGSVCP